MIKSLFTEKQRFNQWWLWLIVIATCIVPIVGIYKQIINDVPFGNNPMSNNTLIMSAAISSSIIVLFLLIRLETNITKESIAFRFFPFVKRNYSFNEIETYKVIDYGFVGGWGIRYTIKYGTVYNTKGTKGLFIKLKDGKTMVVGTQKPEELQRIIKQLNT